MDQAAQDSAPEYEVLQNVPTTSESYVPYHGNMYPEAYPPPQQNQQQDYTYDMSPVPETPANYEEVRADEMVDEDEEEPENSQNPRYTPPTMTPRKLGVLLDQERFLPIANVARIMKTRCEDGTKISKDAKECVQECLSEFISFLTAEAAELCHQAKRKTITADDLLTAMEGLGFDNYAEPMRITLAKYRQANKLTGPIHKEHATYVRPAHFANDPPFRPLFFQTENGTRCTETRYFNIESGGIIPTDAELDAEWQHLQEPEVVQPRNSAIPQAVVPPNNSLPNYQPPSQTTPIAQPGTLPITALEQQTQMQIYVDASTKQHYAAMDTENGVQLYPINISSTAPITLTNLESPMNTNPSTSQGTQSYMYQTDGDRPTDEAIDQHEQQPNNQF